jgi:hypothetical protein
MSDYEKIMGVANFDELLKEECNQIINVIERYVRMESESVRIVFYVCLSAKSENPLNLFLKGESSTGKTWIVTNVVKLFSKHDVWMLGGLSPKALIHQKGEIVDENGEPIEKPRKVSKKELRENPALREKYEMEMEEYRRKMRNSQILIDMTGKILVFLEAPSRETFQMLRPILSHDSKEIMFKFVDKGQETLSTKTVVIRGWPAMICCAAEVEWIEEMINRSLTISPKISAEKFREAHRVTALRFLNPIEDRIRQHEVEEAMKTVSKIWTNFKTLIPYGDIIAEIYPVNLPRTMRDFKYFLGLIECHILTSPHPSIFHPILGEFRIATIADLQEIEKIWQNVYVQTISGLPETALKLYKIIEEIASKGIDPTVKEIVKAFVEKHGYTISSRCVRVYAKYLDDYGLVETVKQNNRNVYYPTNLEGESSAFNFTSEVLKRFSENKLESWLFEVGGKIADLYRVETPTLHLLVPLYGDDSQQKRTEMYINSSIKKAVWKYPFPSEAVKTLYKALIFPPLQLEQESSPDSEKKPKPLEVKKISEFLQDSSEKGEVEKNG